MSGESRPYAEISATAHPVEDGLGWPGPASPGGGGLGWPGDAIGRTGGATA